MSVCEAGFANEAQLREWCERICGVGYRGTATAVHDELIDWLIEQLTSIPGVRVRTDEYELLAWHPVPEGDLVRAGALRYGGEDIAIAGAVPYSLPTTRSGPLVHIPREQSISAEVAEGKVVLRDFPTFALPYDLLFGSHLHLSPDTDQLRGRIWDRPGLANSVLHDDLLAAGGAGANGVVFAFDLPREQVAGYFEPHMGTHYRVPAVFVGSGEHAALRELARRGDEVDITVSAVVQPRVTRNVHATVPGQSDERIILVTHTDGNTWVQENGVAALLAIGAYVAALPVDERRRTIELTFTSGHLHISREGSHRYSAQLDREYDDGTIACVFAIEHLGARVLDPQPRAGHPGRELVFGDEPEILLWCVGPSDAMRAAVIDAVERRGLARVLVAPGFGAPVPGQVPPIVSFGGIGTPYNAHLVPTTSILTGPWSLWAPSFGSSAIDIGWLRKQALAAADVVRALDPVPREALAGDYLALRAARAEGATAGRDVEPPERLPR
ncbi:MAG TPA: hypothetical protein VMK16_11325 [Acidimicrobiales bacterium]|nr:hypothetical protein [Acidimicrobiales bacterium]